MPRQRHQEPGKLLKQTSAGVWFVRPWVDVVAPDGTIQRAKKTITIGKMPKREALSGANEIMATINRADYMVTSQIRFGSFLMEYDALHIEKRLAPSAQEKYRNHIKNHLRPAFEKHMLCELQPLLVQKWLDAKEPTLGWWARTDLRNILSSIFTKAIEWGRFKDRNPIEYVHVGKKSVEREQKKLTDDQTRRLLAALPADVRLMSCVGLFCTLRVSETLGLQEKHLDFESGLILVRQSWYRGTLRDCTKSDRSRRDVPMGYLADDLKRICKGDPERYVFEIQTHPKWGRETAICRDDRDLNQHFLRAAAKDLGFYWQGFGWHALRREAVTAIGSVLGIGQTMRLSGHSTVNMSLHYTLADAGAQSDAIKARQELLIGKTGEKVQ